MRLMLCVLALFSIHAFAECPNLANKYTCTTDDGEPQSLTVTQSVQNDVTVYNVGGKWEIPADKQTHPFPDGGLIKRGEFTATCDNDGNLDVLLKGHLVWGKSYTGYLDSVSVVSQAASSMKIRANYKFIPADGADKNGTWTMNCVPAQ